MTSLRALSNVLRRARSRGVLVIDDDPNVRATLLTILLQHGYGPIAQAHDAESALEAAYRHRPRYIVTDRVFSEGDGPSAVAFLRRLLPDTRIVVFTGDPETVKWADVVVTKPDINALLEALEQPAPAIGQQLRTGPWPREFADAVTPIAGSIVTLSDHWMELSETQRADLIARALARIDPATRVANKSLHPRELPAISASLLHLKKTLEKATDATALPSDQYQRDLLDHAARVIRSLVLTRNRT